MEKRTIKTDKPIKMLNLTGFVRMVAPMCRCRNLIIA
jgi:hypothetical protein